MATTSSTSTSVGSGYDWQSLISAMMAIEEQPKTLMQSQQTTLTGKKTLYNEILNQLTNVQTAAKAVTDINNVKLANVTVSDSDALSASADNSAATGTYNVTVHQLATSTRVTSGFITALGISATADTTKTINSDASHLGQTFTDGVVTINGTQVSIDATNDTLDAIMARINATVSGVTASYDAATDTMKLSSASTITVGAVGDTSNFLTLTGLTSSVDSINGGNHERVTTHRMGRLSTSGHLADQALSSTLTGTGSFTINGVSIDYDASVDGLNDVISRINTKVANVVATYDAQTDKLILASKTSGSLDISRADTSGNFLRTMGLLASGGDSKSVTSLGQNAKITVEGYNNGNPIYSTSNTIDSAVPGLSLTLKQADVAKTVSVTVARSTSDLKTKVRNFVTAYNSAMSLISSRLTEEKIANATSETAKRVGLLRGDSLLSTIKTSLGSLVTQTITGLPTGANRLGNVGVTISKTGYKDGQIDFNEETFDKAFSDNYQQAYNVLFNDADHDGKVDTGEKGAMVSMLDKLKALVDTSNGTIGTTSLTSPLGELPRRTATLDRQYKDLQARIDAITDRLTLREEAMRKQFQNAESLITAYKAQMSNFSYYG